MERVGLAQVLVRPRSAWPARLAAGHGRYRGWFGQLQAHRVPLGGPRGGLFNRVRAPPASFAVDRVMEVVRERFNESGDFVFQTDPEVTIKDVLKVLVSVMRNEKRWRTIVK